MKKHIKKSLQLAGIVFASLVIMTGCANQSSNPEWVSAELSYMNVVYVGVDNPLIIAASDHRGNELEVSIDNGKVVGSDGEYMISPAKAGTAKLTISAGGKLIGEKNLRALSLPDPPAGVYVDLDGKKVFVQKAVLTLEELIEIDDIRAELTDFLWDVEYEVVSFNMVVTDIKGITMVLKSDSNQITEEQKNLIKRLRPVNTVLIEDIYAIGPDGLKRKLNDISLKIVDV